MKVKTNKLFVACKVYDYTIETEPWIQYESFGRQEHNILVKPKKVLIREVEDEKGISYVDCKQKKEVYVEDYTSSYESESTCTDSLILSGYPLGPLTYVRNRYYEQKSREVSFLIPFCEYVKDRLGFDLGEEISLAKAEMIVNLLNTAEKRPFFLSFDSEIASQQIDQKVYKKKLTKEQKR